MAQAVDEEYLRQKAREKYWSHSDRGSYSCPDCGRTEKQLLEHFEVHHIDGDVTNNDLENLVGLCQVCHNLREGKKPSIRKNKHLIGHFSGEPVGQTITGVPVCESDEEYGEFQERCFEICKPALLIDKRRARKWIPVEVDLLSLNGAFKLTTGDVDESLEVKVSRKASSLINRVLEQYKDVETGRNFNYRIHQFPEEPNGGFHSFPGMKLEVAKSLASELRIILENPMNWVPADEYRIKQHIDEYGYAQIEMENLTWLPPEQQRQPWRIEEGHYQDMCEMCGENPVPKVKPPAKQPEHCEECQEKLVWMYSDCDHEEKPHRDPDTDELIFICSKCSLTKSKRFL